jgi:hypothetical protein
MSLRGWRNSTKVSIDSSVSSIILITCTADRAPGDRITLTEFHAEYGHEYHALSVEKREEYLEELKGLKQARFEQEHSTVRKLGPYASADVRTTVKNLVESTINLPNRAGYAVISLGARTDYGGTADPFDCVPECLDGFFESTFGITPSLISKKMETYLLRGAAAAVEEKETKRADVRTDLAEELRRSFGM